ncbi:MAG: Rrf2 family transcriptional regulator [candidate division Zixibacteria bacterium]|nr:Rrf2 family transcriptional regulator [candidate division Zixibacteria bacterium]
MELTKAGDYGFLGILYLAKHPDKKVVRLSEISENENIPEKFLAKIFQSYTRSGLVKSHRGAKGGFSMAKPADEITIKDILESVQGPMQLTRCMNDSESCVRKNYCPLRKMWGKAQDYVTALLDNKTLADIISS